MKIMERAFPNEKLRIAVSLAGLLGGSFVLSRGVVAGMSQTVLRLLVQSVDTVFLW